MINGPKSRGKGVAEVEGTKAWGVKSPSTTDLKYHAADRTASAFAPSPLDGFT